jgi:DNA-binding transcriptional ArsR family regulator
MPPIQQFAALADETRCRVLELLHERARPVHELAGEFAISRPAISRHLRVLKQAGLVREEKRGRENVYAFDATQLEPAGHWLGRFAPPAQEQKQEPEPAPPIVQAVEAALGLPPIAERRSSSKARPKATPSSMPDLFDFAG